MSLLNGTRITWLGHSTVLVETAKGTRILIDPIYRAESEVSQGLCAAGEDRLHSADSRTWGSYLRCGAGGGRTWKHGGSQSMSWRPMWRPRE